MQIRQMVSTFGYLRQKTTYSYSFQIWLSHLGKPLPRKTSQRKRCPLHLTCYSDAHQVLASSFPPMAAHVNNKYARYVCYMEVSKTQGFPSSGPLKGTPPFLGSEAPKPLTCQVHSWRPRLRHLISDDVTWSLLRVEGRHSLKKYGGEFSPNPERSPQTRAPW